MKNFLKSPSRQQRDPDARIASLRELDPNDAEGAGALAAAARSDEDPRVRLAAIGRIADGEALAALYADAPGVAGGRDPNDAEAVRDAVFARAASLLDGGEAGLGAPVQERLLELDAARFAPLVAARSGEAALRARALDAVDDEAGLVRVVQGAGFHEARLGAAERLHTHDGIRQALAAVRSRDKVVARILQQRLDAEARAESERIAALHAVSSTLEATRQLAGSVWSPQHEGRMRALAERWAGLDEALRAEQQAAFDEAHERARATIEAHAPAEAPNADDPGDTAAGVAGAGQDVEGAGEASPDDAPDGEAASGADAAGEGAAPERAPPPPLEMDDAARETLERLRGAILFEGDAPAARADAAPAPAEKLEEPTESVPDRSGPADGTNDAADDAVPGDAASGDAAPDDAAPGDAVAGDAAPTDAASDDAAPADAVAAPADVSAETSAEDVPAEESGETEATRETGAPAATLADVLAGLDADPVPGADASEAAKGLRQLAAAVAVLFDPPFALQGARPGVVRQRRERIDALLDTDALLPGVPVDGVVWLEGLAAHRDALVGRLEQSTQESADRLRATQRQFGALSGLVKEGKWAPANSLFKRLKKKVDAMEPAERREIADRLARAEKQIAEMADWQDFAAKPKLEELVTHAQALAQAADMSPESRLQKLRELQAEWKSLGASRASNEVWPRFKEASDAAYEPAKAFFEERAKERESFAAERLALVEELEATAGDASGDDVDARALQRRVADAKKLWSRTRVRNRKPDRALEKRFTEALKPFEAVTAGEFEKNLAERRSLVERMEALAEGEITQHAANQAKSLQAAWKLVGPVPRREDQKLWEAFRAAGTRVFDARRQASAEQRQAELGHVYRAREIVDELRKLGRRDAVDEAEVAKLTGEFETLPEFPERDRNGLRKAYEGALSGLSKQREAAQRRRREASLDEARRLVGLCERIEYALEHGSDAGDPLALREDVVDAWAHGSDVDVPRDVAAPLEARRDAALAHLTAGTAPDWDANEELRRDLLIRMEVAADAETPSEDKSRRMRFQLANLQEGMTGGAVVDRRTRLAELEREWLAAPPVRTAVRDALNSRYLAATGR